MKQIFSSNRPDINMTLKTKRFRVEQLPRLSSETRWRTEAMRSYAQALLIWFTRGQGRITVAGVTHGFGPHHAVFMPSGTMHGYEMLGQVFGTAMLEGTGGGIVNVVALLGRGFPGIAHTSAARAGVLELTRTLAYEWGPKIRINCLAPGPVGTAGFQETYPKNVLKAMQDIPIPRPGSPIEIANCAVFLASPAASYVTGECFTVAGGQHIQGRNQVFARPKFGVVSSVEPDVDKL